MDLATLTGQDYQEVVLDGLKYRVGPLTAREWGALQAWLKANVPGPLAAALAQLNEARAQGVEVDPGDRQAVIREANLAARSWPPQVGSTAWFEALAGEEGDAAFLHAVLTKHQPRLTIEQAAAIVAAGVPEEDFRRLGKLAFGLPDSPPKAAAPAAGATTEAAGSSTTGPASSTA